MSHMKYGELLEQLKKLSPEELKQPVQFALPEPNGDKRVTLYGCYELGYASDFEGQGTRSVLDNEHHPEQVVIHSDQNPFSEDGDSIYELREDGKFYGNKTGKLLD